MQSSPIQCSPQPQTSSSQVSPLLAIQPTISRSGPCSRTSSPLCDVENRSPDISEKSDANVSCFATSITKSDGKWLQRFELPSKVRKSFFCFFFRVGVMYLGEYDACDVTLSVYPHRASLKNMPGHVGNQTYDLWNTSPMLCQLSYAVRLVRVCDIAELSLVFFISM